MTSCPLPWPSITSTTTSSTCRGSCSSTASASSASASRSAGSSRPAARSLNVRTLVAQVAPTESTAPVPGEEGDMATMSLATEPGRVMGTVYYMAPEQVRGTWQEIGPWTDLYALGCLAVHLVSGAPPSSICGT